MSEPGERIKRRPETLWRLVDVRCNQLAEAISGARTPFLLAMTWSLLIGWQAYVSNYGAAEQLRLQTEQRYFEISTGAPAAVADNCNKFRLGHKISATDKNFKQEQTVCTEIVKKKAEWYEQAALETRSFSLPGGLPKISGSDIGFIAEITLLLILIWQLYAMRRENFALREFVDRVRPKSVLFWRPAFELQPKDRFLSAEHLAFAYFSVSQRFLFLVSTFSAPLFIGTILLCAFPAAIITANTVSDVSTINSLPPGLVTSDYSSWLHTLSAFEVLLLVFILLVTAMSIRRTADTALLLNAWSIAVRDVWMDEWDESTDYPASPVLIDLTNQTASLARAPSAVAKT